MSDQVAENLSFVKRTNILVFLVLCIVGSLLGLFAGAFLAVMIEDLFGMPNKGGTTSLEVISIIAGGALPTILLLRARRVRNAAKYQSTSAINASVEDIAPQQSGTEPDRNQEKTEPDTVEIAQNWYYTSAGVKQGPVSQSKLRQLLSTHVIDSNTQVWRKGFKDWMPASEAGLTEASEAPPPISAKFVNNNLAWLIAFLPLIIAIIDATIIQIRAERALTTGSPDIVNLFGNVRAFGLPWYVYGAFTAIITWIDAKRLHNAGYKVNLPILILVIPPIYLFIRAQRLQQFPYYGLAWIVSFVVSLWLT